MRNKFQGNEYLSVLRQFFGRRLSNTYVLKGQHPGPDVAIFAGVHGNEHCGLKAMAELLPTLAITHGTATFLVGNPRASLKGVRYECKELNLNRFGLPSDTFSEFQKESYEYGRSKLLKQVLRSSDALLDIHSGTSLKEPIIICERNSIPIAQYLPKDFTRQIYGFDAIEPGAWDGYMLSLKKPGMTIECGYHEDPNGQKYASGAITAFLYAAGSFGAIHNLPIITRSEVQMFCLYKTQTNQFTLEKDFQSLEKLAQGDTIGNDGGIEICSPGDCVILFPHNCTEIDAEAFLLGYEL